jgi:hypothetical protein
MSTYSRAGSALKVVEPRLLLELLVGLFTDPPGLDRGSERFDAGFGRQVRRIIFCSAVERRSRWRLVSCLQSCVIGSHDGNWRSASSPSSWFCGCLADSSDFSSPICAASLGGRNGRPSRRRQKCGVLSHWPPCRSKPKRRRKLEWTPDSAAPWEVRARLLSVSPHRNGTPPGIGTSWWGPIGAYRDRPSRFQCYINEVDRPS